MNALTGRLLGGEWRYIGLGSDGRCGGRSVPSVDSTAHLNSSGALWMMARRWGSSGSVCRLSERDDVLNKFAELICPCSGLRAASFTAPALRLI